MTEKELKSRLGTRGQEDEEGDAIMWVLPLYALNGGRANSGQNMRGLGEFHFVCLPNSSYVLTEDELKPYRDYIAKKTPVVKSVSKIKKE